MKGALAGRERTLNDSNMENDPQVGSYDTSKRRAWLAWILASTLLPALPQILFGGGGGLGHGFSGLLGDNRLASMAALIFTLICQLISSIWLANVTSRRKSALLLLSLAVVFTLSSVIVGCASFFAACELGNSPAWQRMDHDRWQQALAQEKASIEAEAKRLGMPATPHHNHFWKESSYYEQSIDQLRTSAASGDVEAAWQLGKMHTYGQKWVGGKEVLHNIKEAERWYRVAAEQNHVGAQYELGVIYTGGERNSGVPADHVEAAKWLQRAANLNYPLAQAYLGMKYESGHGVPKDLVAASAWFRLAALNGSDDGVQRIMTIQPKMTTDQIEAGRKLANELLKQIKSSGAQSWEMLHPTRAEK